MGQEAFGKGNTICSKMSVKIQSSSIINAIVLQIHESCWWNRNRFIPCYNLVFSFHIQPVTFAARHTEFFIFVSCHSPFNLQ